MEEKQRLKNDNNYMKQKVQEKCHEFQRIEKELKRYSRKWHVLKKGKIDLEQGTDRLVRDPLASG